MFSSEKQDWETPWDLFNKLNEEFHFDIDVCATPENTKCKSWFTPEIDGLSQDWQGTCWMNPPYNKPENKCKSNCKKKSCKKRGYHNKEYVPGQIDWVRKAYEESLKGATVVCLIPARTDTELWHKYVMRSSEIRFIEGRLIFVGAESGAPFPSAIVIFRPEQSELKVCSMEVS